MTTPVLVHRYRELLEAQDLLEAQQRQAGRAQAEALRRLKRLRQRVRAFGDETLEHLQAIDRERTEAESHNPSARQAAYYRERGLKHVIGGGRGN